MCRDASFLPTIVFEKNVHTEKMEFQFYNTYITALVLVVVD